MPSIIVHYGRTGMKWGVRNDEKYAANRAREQKKLTKRNQEKAKRKEANAAKRTSDAKAAAAKKAAAGGPGGGGGGAAGEAEEKGKATAESVYDKAFQEAMADIEPPITEKKIAAAQKKAEKAVEEAGLNEKKEGKGGKAEKEKKGGPAPKEDAKAKEKKARDKLASQRSDAAKIGTAIAAGMTDGSERTPEKLAAEAQGINKMLKMVEHDKANHGKLRTIGARALAESKGGTKRSPEQLKEDAAFVKKMSERFAEESEFMKNFGKKDKKAKHSDDMILVEIGEVFVDEVIYG